MKSEIKITSKVGNLIQGTIDEYYFQVGVDNKLDGIDPVTLEKGEGLIYLLTIYELKSKIDGNPMLPSKTGESICYAYFKPYEGWQCLSSNHTQRVKDLINYIIIREDMRSVK